VVLKYNLYDNQIITTLKKVILVYDTKEKKRNYQQTATFRIFCVIYADNCIIFAALFAHLDVKRTSRHGRRQREKVFVEVLYVL